MGLLDRFSFRSARPTSLATIGKREQVIAGDDPDAAHGLLRQMLTGLTPPRLGTHAFLEAYKRMPWLHAAVRRRAEGLAELEWEVYGGARSTGNVRSLYRGAVAEVKRKARRPHLLDAATIRARATKSLVASGALTRLDGHALYELLERPNPAMTGRTLWQLASKHLDLSGENLWIRERREGMGGPPKELWPISPAWVIKTPSQRSPWYEVQSQAWRAKIPESEMVWMRHLDPADPYQRGVGIAQAIGDELESDDYASKMGKSRFFNRMNVDVMVSLDKMSDVELKKHVVEFKNQHEGPDAAAGWHWFNRDVKVTPVSQTMVEAQYVEFRKLMRDFCIQVFGVPPEVLGIIENSNRASIQAAQLLFALLCTVPTAEFIATELNAWLIPDYVGENLVLSYVSPVPDDVEAEDRVMAAVPAAFTIDEYRERAGYEPLPNGEGRVHMGPTGQVVASLADLQGNPLAGLLGGTGGGAGSSATTTLLGQLLGRQAPPQHPIVDVAPVRVRAVSSAEIAAILSSVDSSVMRAELEPVVRDLLEQWGRDAYLQVAGAAPFNLGDPRFQEFVDKVLADAVDEINHTTTARIQQALTDGDGNTVDAVRQVFRDADINRSGLIASQTLITSTEYAQLVAWDQAGIATREWIATPDGRTRDEHWNLDGQRVPLGQPFVVASGPYAGAMAMSPGTFGIAALDMRCRCTTAPVASQRMMPEDRRVYWRQIEKAREPWEVRLERAASIAFTRQERAVVAALRNAA